MLPGPYTTAEKKVLLGPCLAPSLEKKPLFPRPQVLAAPHGGERGKSFGPSLQVSPPLKVLRKAFSNDLTTYVPRTAAHVTASSHTPESLNLHVTIRACSCTMYAAVCSCFLGGGGVSAGDYKSISSIPPPPPSSQRPLKKKKLEGKGGM